MVSLRTCCLCGNIRTGTFILGSLSILLGGVFLAQSVALSLLAYALSYALVAVIAVACLRDVDMTGLPLSRLEGPQPKP